MREVIVVCYGNICRSPIGEVLLARALDERLGPGHEVVVSSAGIGADDGRPPSRGSVQSLVPHGFDLRSHRSRYLTRSMAARAWRIYCMEEDQVAQVRRMVGDGVWVGTLGEEVEDPLGATQDAYDAVAAQIARLVPGVVDDIASEVGE